MFQFAINLGDGVTGMLGDETDDEKMAGVLQTRVYFLPFTAHVAGVIAYTWRRRGSMQHPNIVSPNIASPNIIFLNIVFPITHTCMT